MLTGEMHKIFNIYNLLNDIKDSFCEQDGLFYLKHLPFLEQNN